MHPVSAVELPTPSYLKSRIAAADFLDCYRVEALISPRCAADIITQFPCWARLLLQLRRAITAPFGLSNDGPPAADKVGVFPVEYDSERELIAGFNDKHLNFRVSVICENGSVHLATWVHAHNLAGRFYLILIMPFHILIARNALKRVAAATASSS